MTSNDAAEDASTLDDDALIEACLGLDQGRPAQTAPVTLPDWPPRRNQMVMVPIDPDIAAWFQVQSGSWRRDIGRVLRGWIAAHEPQPEATASATITNPPADPASLPR